MFGSNNSYFRIVAHNPYSKNIRPITDVYNLQDETLSEKTLDLDEQSTTSLRIVQTKPLEVIVTETQNTVTFNEESDQIHTDVPDSESETD